MKRIPPWIRQTIRTTGQYGAVSRSVHSRGLHTVCRSARCPNRATCWNAGTATFMIMGNVCTRGCAFCGVASGVPAAPAADEPRRVADAALELGLRYVVVTSVTRDDLPDGGSGHFSAVLGALREAGMARVEVLTPDFKGAGDALDVIRDAGPAVFNHNVETVRRLQAAIRPAASYGCSLGVLAGMAKRGLLVKSGLMAGLGETDEEVLETIDDLAAAGCRILTIGQYLMPSRAAWPVARYVRPEVFDAYREYALGRGFKAVASGPLVRSSWQAEVLMQEASG